MQIWLCKVTSLLKTNNASLLRYEVSDSMKIKAYILINQKSISEFPYLEKDEILNKTKQIDNRTSKEKLPRPVSSNEEIQKLAKNRLDRVSREDMQNYF